MHECLRCGWEWDGRVEGRPKNCPGCKSPVWDRPKVEGKIAAKAHRIVADAVKNGLLKKMPCEDCGEIKTDAHHENYDKPLEVKWLCRKHHRQRHVEIGGPLMRGALNLRGVPNDLTRQLKAEAYLIGMGFHEYCVGILECAMAVAKKNREDEESGVSKKIANVSAGGGATEGGGDSGLPRGGKAQDGDEVPFIYGRAGIAPNFNEVHVPIIQKAHDGYTADRAVEDMMENLRLSGVRREAAFRMPEWSEERLRELADAEPGGLMACSPEILGHMLEDANTNAATAMKLHLAGVELDRDILVRWGLAENNKPKLESGIGNEKIVEENKGVEAPAARKKTRRHPKAAQESADGPKSNSVGAGKPGVDMQALRNICAGNLQPLAISGNIPSDLKPLNTPADYGEVDLCGFESYNEIDGENYVCGKEKHGPKIKHGEWIKI